MIGNEFYLKLKTKDEHIELRNSVNESISLAELQKKISEVSNIKILNLKILFGYPRKPLNFPLEQSLEKCGIKCGDTLFVEEEENYNKFIEIKGNLERNVIKQDMNELNQSLTTNNKLHITTNDERNKLKGIFLRKEVPSDNSCLFTSVGFVISSKVDLSVKTYLRQLVSDTISANPEEYNAAILGKPINEYCEWILNPNSWGGAIELAVLSNHYGFEIAVLNSVTGNINIFGEDRHYQQRVFLLFDGIHYDPLYMDFPETDKIQTIFLTNDEDVLQAAEQLVIETKNNKQFTDVNQFMICCAICNCVVTGQSEAQKHARETGHTSFNEVTT